MRATLRAASAALLITTSSRRSLPTMHWSAARGLSRSSALRGGRTSTCLRIPTDGRGARPTSWVTARRIRLSLETPTSTVRRVQAAWALVRSCLSAGQTSQSTATRTVARSTMMATRRQQERCGHRTRARRTRLSRSAAQLLAHPCSRTSISSAISCVGAEETRAVSPPAASAGSHVREAHASLGLG